MSLPYANFSSQAISAPDGREIAYTEFGDPDGYPVLFSHGMPGSQLEGRFFDFQARRWGFRIITMARPGIGLSTYQPNRILLDYIRDTELLTKKLGINEFVKMGWSSGGSRSLAVAYGMKNQVKLTVIMSSYTHFEELKDSRILLLKTRWPGPALWEISPKLFECSVNLVVKLARLRPSVYLKQENKIVSKHDRELLKQTNYNYLFRQDQLESLQSGGKAIAKDLETEICNWGFQLDEVKPPVWIYQGEEDPFVPRLFSEHLHAHLPNSSLFLLPDCGHLYPLDEAYQDALFRKIHQALADDHSSYLQQNENRVHEAPIISTTSTSFDLPQKSQPPL